jgi:hypothetical protein
MVLLFTHKLENHAGEISGRASKFPCTDLPDQSGALLFWLISSCLTQVVVVAQIAGLKCCTYNGRNLPSWNWKVAPLLARKN